MPRATGAAGSYRREARMFLDELKGFQLRVARDFLSFLRLKDGRDASLEILADRRLGLDIRAAVTDWRKGRRSSFTPWKGLK